MSTLQKKLFGNFEVVYLKISQFIRNDEECRILKSQRLSQPLTSMAKSKIKMSMNVFFISVGK
jgi:hypothetical protein